MNSSYVRNGEINPSELTAFTDITEEVENLIEGTRSRIEQAIRVAEAYDMPDPAPERAKLKSYEDWLSVRQNMQPPLPEDSIHFLPSMDAERATQLIKEGITTVDKIKDRLSDLADKLRGDHNKMYWLKIASAIMTTDTKPKIAYEEIVVGDELIRICGIAKGSGMIAPNLATMLSFIFTNADINSNLLKTLLKRAVSNSFNAITVDSDQSTNDMVSIFSTRMLKIGEQTGMAHLASSAL